jgi:peptidoglycan/LPS O-acetylase OafA/YrhL
VNAPAIQPRGEIRALTGLRIVAAVWVVLVHAQTPLLESVGGYLAPVWPVVTSGWMGVDLFFILSGYVLTLSYVDSMGSRWDSRKAVVFLWARLSRVWPLWALLTVTMFVWLRATGWVLVSAEADKRQVTVVSLVEQLGLAQMWHRESNAGASFIGPGWSLSVEMAAYLAFPLLILVVGRLRRLPAVVLAALAVAAMVPLALLAYQTGLVNDLLPWPLRIAGAVVAGSITSIFVERIRRSPRTERIAARVAVVCAAEIVLVCYWSSLRVQNGGIDQAGVAVVFFPVLVGALALSDRGLSRVLSRETIVLGGRISFALYLVHTCCIEVAAYLQEHVAFLAAGSPGWTLLQAHMIPVSILFSYLLWRYVEEPGRKFLRSRGPGRWSMAPARPIVAARHDESVDRFEETPDEAVTARLRIPGQREDRVHARPPAHRAADSEPLSRV